MNFIQRLTFLGVMALMINSSVFAQNTYDIMLKAMYKKTVPLVSVTATDSIDEVLFLDTREREEFLTSHIEGALHVGYDSFSKKKVKNIPKDADIVVYCSVGYRSERIGEKLMGMGFTSVNNLYGGIFQWKNEGRNLVNMKKQSTDTVHTYNKLWSVWLKNGVKKYD